MLRPALPYAGVEGITNAAVLNHSLMDAWPEGSAPLAIRFGRQLLPSAFTSAQDIRTLNGVPLSASKMLLICQRPKTLFRSSRPRERSDGRRPNGISHTKLPTRRFVRSKLESPRSRLVLSGS